MMKKLTPLLILLMLFLAACGSTPAQAVPTAVPTADARLATPGTGFVTVRTLQNMEALLLRSQPDPASALTGKVAPGANGKLVGFNAEGTWALIQFPELSGWAPVEALDLTIAQ